MVVRSLWRYPVKSLAGERLEAAEVEQRGVVGDRRWALVDADGKLASGKDSRRFRKVPGLLMHAPSPDVDAVALAGPGWELREEREVSHFDAAPIHLVTTATLERLGGLPEERLRPNIVVDGANGAGFPEDAWLGVTLRVGDVVLRVIERTERCVMVNHARPGIERRNDVLKQIGRANQACAGVYAEVIRAGRIVVGDAVASVGRG